MMKKSTKKVSAKGGSASGGKKIKKQSEKFAKGGHLSDGRQTPGGKEPEKKQIVLKEKKTLRPARYFEAKGGRKTAVARVRLSPKQIGVIVNGKDYKDYFRDLHLQKKVLQPLEIMNILDRLGATVKVKGGGIKGQAGAVCHGIARALTVFNPDFRKRLRRAGLLTRDARMVERKKYGLKKARRAPQWKKR